MSAANDDRRPGKILSILKNKCPRCRRGDMFQFSNAYNFKTYMKMNEKCAVCNQPFELEVGFYYGTGFVSYALGIVLSVVSFIAWWVVVGISFRDNRVLWWLLFNGIILLILQPPLMRLSRSVWLAIFVRYSNEWKKGEAVNVERTNKDQMHNW